MDKVRNNKQFLDPATASVIGVFVAKSAIQGAIGWIAGRIAHRFWNWIKRKMNGKLNERVSTTEQK